MQIGLPELDKKLTAMGATKSQLSSTVKQMMLAIFHDKDNAEMLHREWQNMLKAAQEKENEYALAIAECKSQAAELMEKEQALNDEKEEFENIKFRITMCKTAAAQDNLRLASFFMKEAQPNNEYQRTEYIRGLGAILARNGEENTDEH